MLFPIESGHACAAPNSGPFPILVRTPDRTRRKYKPRCDLDVKKFNSEPGSCKRPASLESPVYSCVIWHNGATPKTPEDRSRGRLYRRRFVRTFKPVCQA